MMAEEIVAAGGLLPDEIMLKVVTSKLQKKLTIQGSEARNCDHYCKNSPTNWSKKSSSEVKSDCVT